MSLKACIKAALNITDDDAASILASHDAYKSAGQYGKDMEAAAVEDVLADAKADRDNYIDLIEESYPEIFKKQSGLAEEDFVDSDTIPEMLKPQNSANVMDGSIPGRPVFDKSTREIGQDAMARVGKNTDKAKAGILRWYTQDALVDGFSRMFEGKVTAVYRNIDKFLDNPLQALNELMRLKQHEAARNTSRVKEHDKRHRILEAKKGGAEHMKQLGEVMNDATIAKVNPHKDFNASENAHLTVKDDPHTTQVNRETYDDIADRYNGLPKSFRDEYHAMEAFYKEQFALLREASIHNLAQVYGNDRFKNRLIKKLISDLINAKKTVEVNKAFDNAFDAFSKDVGADVETKATYKKLVASRAEFKQGVQSMNNHEHKAGPYFPLKRYGRYQLAAVDPETGEKHYFRSDDKYELEENAKRLSDNGVEVGAIRAVDTSNISYSAKNANMVLENALSRVADNSKARKEITSAITQAFAAASPDSSMAKHFMSRSGIAGASTNVRRNMASYAQAASWSMASLKYSKDIHTALGNMRQADKLGGNDGLAMSNATNEMTRRVNDPAKAAGAVMGVAAQYSFLNYLMSFSYSIVNSTQVAVVSLPRMAEAYGTKKSTASLAKAYGIVAPGIGKALKDAKLGGKAFTPEGVDLDSSIKNVMNRVTDSKTRDMLDVLRGRDMLGGGLTFDVTESAKGKGHGKLAAGMNAFIEMGRTMPMMVEEMNRIVTALSTYELAMEKHGNHEQAIEDAEHMIIKTHFDYTDLNKPPMFTKNDLMRAATTYKMHPLGLYMNLAHYINGIKDPATRKNATKGLALFMGSHAMFAGIAGGIILEPIGLAMKAIAAGMDDDDEMKELFANPDLLVREATFALTGSSKASEVLTYGAPRLFGVDMYSRIGMHRGMIQIAEGETALETVVDSAVASVVGPIFSIKDQYKNMAAHFAAGDTYWNSVSYAVPKVARDLIRAFGLHNDGMKDFSGNTIRDADEFGLGSAITKAIGFSTSQEAEVHSNRNRDRGRKKTLDKKRTYLTRQYINAKNAQRNALLRNEIREYNKALAPEERRQYQITVSKLLKSQKRRSERERKTIHGVYNKGPKGNNYPYTTLDR